MRSIDYPLKVTHSKSVDATEKLLLRFGDGRSVESVFIPMGVRGKERDEEQVTEENGASPDSSFGAACLSSQTACTLNCSFCHTGWEEMSKWDVGRIGIDGWGRLNAEIYAEEFGT